MHNDAQFDQQYLNILLELDCHFTLIFLIQETDQIPDFINIINQIYTWGTHKLTKNKMLWEMLKGLLDCTI